MVFDGFPKETLTFLHGLTRNNSKEWFDAHRDEYEKYYMDPTREFVVALGERIKRFEPNITAEPRVNKTIFRINRDIRFSKDKTPYKNHIDLWFYDGENRKAGPSGFYLRLLSTRVMLGTGIHAFDKDGLAKFRDAVDREDSGKALAKAMKQVSGKGYKVEGEHYKQVPRGYETDHKRAELLRYNSLHASFDAKLPPEFHSKSFVKWCADHYKKVQPIHRWLVENVQS